MARSYPVWQTNKAMVGPMPDPTMQQAQDALASLSEARGSALTDELRQELWRWLSESHYEAEQAGLRETVQAAASSDEAWSEIQDAFRQTLPIGTGGRRGKVAPGPNRVNRVILRETIYGLHCTMQSLGWAPKVIVGFDTRWDSQRFAHQASALLLELGHEVLLVDEARATPQIAFGLRAQGCGAGVVISASHNPPGDNGIKIYGPDGAQVFAKRDKALTQAMLEQGPQAPEGPDALNPTHPKLVRVDIASADRAYLAEVRAQGLCPELDLGGCGPVVYTALQGVGFPIMSTLLRERGVALHAVAEQCEAGDGRFSQTSATNPEDPRAFDAAMKRASEVGAKVILANDPDADRLGVCLWSERQGAFQVLPGNDVCAILSWHVCSLAQPQPDALVATTLVTSPLVEKIGRDFGFPVVSDLLVGFKHHAAYLDHHPDMRLAFGCEESLGYIRGANIRDKDGAIAALLMVELLARLEQQGETWEQRLDTIWVQYGVHVNHTENLRFEGQRGAEAMQKVMASWRSSPPLSLGRFKCRGFEDRLSPEFAERAQELGPVRGAMSNLLIGVFESEGARVKLVLRPSGTEPKLKLYLLSESSVPNLDALETVKAKVEEDQRELLALAKAQVLACA